MIMELFIHFVRKGRALKDRRLRINIDNDTCAISEEFKIKDTWLDDRDGYNIIDFPIENISDLIKQLQRVEKLLVLK